MAISIENQRTASTFKQLTGLGKFSVVGWGLTKDELAKLGINYKQEPKTIDTRENVSQFNLDKRDESGELIEEKINVKRRTLSVWLKLENETVVEAKTKDGVTTATSVPNPCKDKYYSVTFFIEDRNWVSAGKQTMQWLNKVGESQWGENEASLPDWFKVKAPIYPAKRGLASLYEFILAWTNVDTSAVNSKVMLGDSPTAIQEIFTKEKSAIIAELNSYVAPLNAQEQKVSILMSVDGDKQCLFSGKFLGEQPGKSAKESLMKAATGKYGVEGDFQDSLELCVYDPNAILLPSSAPAATTAVVDTTSPAMDTPKQPQVDLGDLPF